MTKNFPILITGSHRSGTTWVGRIISSSPEIFYIHEPFTPCVNHYPGLDNHNTNFEHWFFYVNRKNEKKYLEGIKKTLNCHYSLFDELKRIKHLRHIKGAIRNYTRFYYCRRKTSRPLFKDPIAFFSSEWLARKFNFKVLILIRHPAAFASSLKKLNWHFDFAEFLKQPELMRELLFDFEEEIKDYATKKRDIIEQAILLWRIINFQVLKFQKRHPDWIYYRYKDLALSPEKEFKKIFSKLGLDFTPAVSRKIKWLSGEGNPIDVPLKRKQRTLVRMNSRESINNFKKRLSPEEIDLIKRKTKDVWQYFYTEKDW